MTALYVEDPQAHNMDSYRSDYTSYDQDSFKPQTPSLSGQQSEQGDVADLARVRDSRPSIRVIACASVVYYNGQRA